MDEINRSAKDKFLAILILAVNIPVNELKQRRLKKLCSTYIIAFFLVFYPSFINFSPNTGLNP